MKTIILGMYLSIVVMSGLAAWHLLTRLIWPTLRDRSVKLERYLLGVGAFMAMVSHTWENVVFGLGRWYESLSFLLTDPRWAAAGKVLILVGAVVTMASLDRAETGSTHLRRWTWIAVSLWTIGIAGAAAFQYLGIGFAVHE